jgi:hypothetical protein
LFKVFKCVVSGLFVFRIECYVHTDGTNEHIVGYNIFDAVIANAEVMRQYIGHIVRFWIARDDGPTGAHTHVLHLKKLVDNV